MLPSSEVENLKKQFEEIDKDHSGNIDAFELGSALKTSKNSEITNFEIDEIIR